MPITITLDGKETNVAPVLSLWLLSSLDALILMVEVLWKPLDVMVVTSLPEPSKKMHGL